MYLFKSYHKIRTLSTCLQNLQYNWKYCIHRQDTLFDIQERRLDHMDYENYLLNTAFHNNQDVVNK